MNYSINQYYQSYKSWKYNLNLDTKNSFQVSDIKDSILIAFFIVLSTSFLLSSLQNSINIQNNIINRTSAKAIPQTINKSPNKIHTTINNILGIQTASANTTTLLQATPQKNTHFLNLKQGQSSNITINLKNTGKNIWPKGKVSLETGPFLKTTSKFKHPSWLTSFRALTLQKNINPGQTATLKLQLKGNQSSGNYQENYQLVFNNYPISQSLVRVFITITDSPKKIPTPQPKTITKITPPPTTLKSQNNNFRVCASSVNTNFPNLFDHDPCQTNTNESQATNTTKTQSITETTTTKTSTNIIHSNTDSITNNIKFTKLPTIRIGLFDTIDAQRLTSNTNYDIYAGNLLLISNLKPNHVSTLSFNNSTKQYAVSTKGTTKFSIFPIRFVPKDSNGIITLIDFDKRPKWNTNLNDNKFRNIIEFNYSNSTKKLWVINELPINNYLKGLSETSNYSPVEYQKVIATAARSYAMYHYNRGINVGNAKASTKHASENYHLDATWDQVYRGYNSEIRLTKLADAVDQTKGQIVTYKNKIIVTPYFSQSDGRTRAWEEVWYGDPKPWLKSVSVPKESNKDMWGHGVGLSARGALYMTRDENINWQDTLKYFYQNTQIQKIY